MTDTPQRPMTRLALGWVMLVLVALALVAPSFVGWHHDDDLQNMRWVLEYRDAPWRALTERHSLHDHIRPATLWATWVGAQLSNGAWWGPHAVMTLLLLGGWLAMAVLVARLVESRVAGFLAAALMLDMEGFRLLLDWDSWINTAGEICFGLVGLILVHKALGRATSSQSSTRTLLGATACIVMAGWFKEPGWVVYPCTAALMGFGALKHGVPRRVAAWVIGMLAIGVLGFAWSHTSANVDRLGTIDIVAKLGDLQHAFRPWIDPWPGIESGTRSWKGIILPLVALALSGSVVLRRSETPTQAQGRAIIMGTVILTGLGYVRDDLVGIIAGVGLIAMLFVHRSALVASLGVLTAGVMFLFPGPNPVQLLLASMAFAALIAIHASRLIRPGGPPALRMFAGIILVMGLGLQAFQIADRAIAPDPSPRNVPSQVSDKNQLLAEAALIHGLGGPLSFYKGELGPRMLGPIYGLRVLPYDPELAPFPMQISDTLWVAAERSAASNLLLDANLLNEAEASGQISHMALTLEPGPYAFGWLAKSAQATPRISLKTSCDTVVVVTNRPAGAVWQMAAVHLEEGCSEVMVQTQAPEASDIQAFFVAKLPEPEANLRGASIHEPVLGLPPINPMPTKH